MHGLALLVCLCGVGQGGVQGCACARSVPTSSVIAGELLGIRYAVCVCVCVCVCGEQWWWDHNKCYDG